MALVQHQTQVQLLLQLLHLLLSDSFFPSFSLFHSHSTVCDESTTISMWNSVSGSSTNGRDSRDERFLCCSRANLLFVSIPDKNLCGDDSNEIWPNAITPSCNQLDLVSVFGRCRCAQSHISYENYVCWKINFILRDSKRTKKQLNFSHTMRLEISKNFTTLFRLFGVPSRLRSHPSSFKVINSIFRMEKVSSLKFQGSGRLFQIWYLHWHHLICIHSRNVIITKSH